MKPPEGLDFLHKTHLRQWDYVVHRILCLAPSDVCSMEVKMQNMLSKFFYGFLERTAILSTWHVKQQMESQHSHGSKGMCRDFFLTPVHLLLRHRKDYGMWCLCSSLLKTQFSQNAPVREVNLDSSFNEARKRNSNFLPELNAACLKGWGPDVELGTDLDLGGAVSADLEAQP